MSTHNRELNFLTSADADLLKAFVEGNFSAFLLLFERHKGGLFRYLLQRLRDQHSADIAFGKTWRKVINKAPGFNCEEKFAVWLYRHARDVVSELRRGPLPVRIRHWNLAEQLDFPKPSPTYDSTAWSADRRRAATEMAECLGALSDAERDAFLLHEEAKLSARDIAVLTGVTLDVCQTRLFGAYKLLQSRLAPAKSRPVQ